MVLSNFWTCLCFCNTFQIAMTLLWLRWEYNGNMLKKNNPALWNRNGSLNDSDQEVEMLFFTSSWQDKQRGPYWWSENSLVQKVMVAISNSAHWFWVVGACSMQAVNWDTRTDISPHSWGRAHIFAIKKCKSGNVGAGFGMGPWFVYKTVLTN